MIALVSNSNCVPCISPPFLYLGTGSWDTYRQLPARIGLYFVGAGDRISISSDPHLCKDDVCGMCYVMSQLHSIQVFSWYFPSASGHPDKVHKEYKAVHYQNFGSLHFMFHVWISGKGHLQKGKIEKFHIRIPPRQVRKKGLKWSVTFRELEVILNLQSRQCFINDECLSQSLWIWNNRTRGTLCIYFIYVPFIISIISGYILFTAARYILITLAFRNV